MRNNICLQTFSKQLIKVLAYRSVVAQAANDLLTDNAALYWLLVLLCSSEHDKTLASNAYARLEHLRSSSESLDTNFRNGANSGSAKSGVAREVSFRYDANGNVIFEKDLPEGMTLEDDENTVAMSRVQKLREDVYAIDEGWGLFATDSASAGSSRASKKNGGRTYTWNERNQLVATVDDSRSTSYVYDYNGVRTNKYSRGTETLYFNQFYSVRYDNGVGYGNGQMVKHIYLGDTRIVTKLNSVKNASYSEEYHKQYYYHSDHLGSASLISDHDGREYQRIEYTPYGETWVERIDPNGVANLPYKFTGKELDEETGLYYYGARYLDAKYSRWLSTDPALQDYIPLAPVDDEAKKHNEKLPGMGGVFNTVNLQLYHYAANNPIKYVDPDGEFATIVGAVIGGIGGALSALAQGNKLGSKGFKAGVVGGAVAGAIAGAALDIAAATVATGGTAALVIGTVGGAIGGGTGSMIESAISGDQIKASNVICDAVIGALGAFGGQLASKGLQHAFQSKLSKMLLNSKTGKDVLVIGNNAKELSLVFGKRAGRIMQILTERGVDEAIAFVTDVLQDKINPGINED